MELTAANKREIELLCARRNEMRRRGQFVGDSAASEDMLDKLLKEDVRLRKVARDSAAPPAPAKPAAATSSPNGQRAVYYVSELIKIMLAIFSDPVLRPMIEQQLKAAGAGAAPAARALPGV